MRRRYFGVTFVIALTLASKAMATPLEDGLNAYKREDYQTAWTLLRPLAETGAPEAQEKIAIMYANAEGVPLNRTEAFRFMAMAATKGYPTAEYHLGEWYRSFNPEGQPNWIESLKWLRKAAEHGQPDAQYELGEAYFIGGYGAAESKAESFRWYEKAAMQGNGRAADKLADFYQFGWVIPKDAVKQFRWNRFAVEHGDLNPLQDLAYAYRDGVGVTRSNIHAYMWFNLAKADIGTRIELVETYSFQAIPRLLAAKYHEQLTKLEKVMTKSELQRAEQLAIICQTSGYKNCE